MKKFIAYQPLLKSIIYLLLVGQLWADVASHLHWIADTKSELIELCDLEGGESEEENKKEKDDKLRIDLVASKFDASLSSVKILHSEDFPTIHHPESITPPPEPFLS